MGHYDGYSPARLEQECLLIDRPMINTTRYDTMRFYTITFRCHYEESGDENYVSD